MNDSRRCCDIPEYIAAAYVSVLYIPTVQFRRPASKDDVMRGAAGYKREQEECLLFHTHTLLTMKFFPSLALSSLFASAAFAQNVAIGAPADGTTVTAGSNMTVEVDRPVC
jgi:hypothetical protein